MIKYLIFIGFFIIFCFHIGCETIEQGNLEQTSLTGSIPVKKSCNFSIKVIGKGAPPTDPNLTEVQKYIFAERSAILDGYRLLSEKLSGLILNSVSSSKNFVLTSDRVKTVTKTFLRNVQIVSIKHNDNGVCEAFLKIDINKESFKKYLAVPVVRKVETCSK